MFAAAICEAQTETTHSVTPFLKLKRMNSFYRHFYDRVSRSK